MLHWSLQEEHRAYRVGEQDQRVGIPEEDVDLRWEALVLEGLER